MLNKEKLCNESLETRLDKFSNGLDKFSNGLERLETWLKPRSSKFSRIEDRVSSIELRETVNLHLSGTVRVFLASTL